MGFGREMERKTEIFFFQERKTESPCSTSKDRSVDRLRINLLSKSSVATTWLFGWLEQE